jgi:hypothetical protein
MRENDFDYIDYSASYDTRELIKGFNQRLEELGRIFNSGNTDSDYMLLKNIQLNQNIINYLSVKDRHSRNHMAALQRTFEAGVQ